MEAGEPLVEALARELREELSVDAAVGELALVHDYIAADRHTVNHAFRASVAGELRVVQQGKLKDARWVPLAELDRLDLRPAIAGVLRRIAASPNAGAIYLPCS